MKKRPPPGCDHCGRACKAIVRNADGVFCSPKHHAAAMKLRAVVALEPVDIAGRIETALALRSAPMIEPPEHAEILERWFAAKSADTRRSYTGHLQHFARWAAGYDPRRFQGTPLAMVLVLLRLPADESNAIVQRWIDTQSPDRGHRNAAAGIVARYRALRSLAKLLKRESHVVEAKPPKLQKRTVFEAREKYRGVAEAFIKIRDGLRELAERKDAKPIDVRDWTLIRFDAGMGLRRYEVVNVDLEHLCGDSAWVHGKGRRDREPRPMSKDLRMEVARWLKVRGKEPGPLFIGMHAKEGKRLSRDAVNKMLARRSAQFKTTPRLKPHDIRRVFCTGAIKKFGAYGAMVHTRHASVDTVMLYDLAAGENAEAEAAQLDAEVAGKKGRKKR